MEEDDLQRVREGSRGSNQVFPNGCAGLPDACELCGAKDDDGVDQGRCPVEQVVALDMRGDAAFTNEFTKELTKPFLFFSVRRGRDIQ